MSGHSAIRECEVCGDEFEYDAHSYKFNDTPYPKICVSCDNLGVHKEELVNYQPRKVSDKPKKDVVVEYKCNMPMWANGWESYKRYKTVKVATEAVKHLTRSAYKNKDDIRLFEYRLKPERNTQ